MGSKDNREIGSRSALVNREHMAMILPAILVTSLVQSSKLAGHSKCIFSFFFFFFLPSESKILTFIFMSSSINMKVSKSAVSLRCYKNMREHPDTRQVWSHLLGLS